MPLRNPFPCDVCGAYGTVTPATRLGSIVVYMFAGTHLVHPRRLRYCQPCWEEAVAAGWDDEPEEDWEALEGD